MIRKLKGVDPFIRTVEGEAVYVGTEIEDKHGRWGDDYYIIRNGFWVIHEGSKHHIYRVKK